MGIWIDKLPILIALQSRVLTIESPMKLCKKLTMSAAQQWWFVKTFLKPSASCNRRFSFIGKKVIFVRAQNELVFQFGSVLKRLSITRLELPSKTANHLLHILITEIDCFGWAATARLKSAGTLGSEFYGHWFLNCIATDSSTSSICYLDPLKNGAKI